MKKASKKATGKASAQKKAAKPQPAKSAKPVKQAKSAKPVKPAKSNKALSVAAPKKGKAPVPAVVVGAAPVKGDKSKKAQDKVRQQLVDALAQMAEEEEVVLTNADGKQYCKAHDCDSIGTSHGYCRLHYIANWKRNKTKLKILSGGMLDKYIEELTSRYPDRYIEIMRKDLSSEKDFHAIISEMEMEDSGDGEFEEDTKFMDEVRGSAPTESSGEEEF